MPDILIHLIDFDFYIVSSCKLLFENDIQKVIDSFKTDQFFIYRYWINIQCYFDPIMSYQHISSTKLIKPIFVHGIVDYPIFFDWKCVKYMMVNLCPSIIGCLKQFDILYPHIKSIQFNIDLQDRKGLGQRRRRAFDKLRKNALSIIRHVEFCLPSCHYGSNESIHMGKNLVSVLSCYMPHIQTLRLWRDDDFPWTSIRPDYGTERMCQIYSGRWIESLRTFQSIVDHVVVFEQNLCELVQNLKELVFIDIYGRIHSEKIEPFRSMVKRRFPNSRLHIEISKFRLWI
ncbi:unnamed protein product [Rotaria sordida]|nr:unnamed protein product [Rotaria sordida]